MEHTTTRNWKPVNKEFAAKLRELADEIESQDTPEPKPEPTALEQLPEAVRKEIEGFKFSSADYKSQEEALAHVILNNAAEIFAAGEPVHGMCINGKSRNKIATALSIGNRSVWTGLQGSDAVFGDVNFVKECRPNGTGLHLSAPNALAFARRTVAIALAARKNAQEDAS